MSKHYYFIGIGGIGMSGLARILIDRGYRVSGSDPASNKQIEDLEARGAIIKHEQVATNIGNDVDIVVITSAIQSNNPELVSAKNKNLKIISRSVLLNEILTKQKAIAVTGTHGKTTTTSMLSMALTEAGFDPTSIIGAEVHSIQGNAKEGQGEYSVGEVCEYERAFLDIYPYGAIITNIEEDHLDCYKDIHDIVDAFSEFANHIPKEGFLTYWGDDENSTKVANSYSGRKFSYGFDPKNSYIATEIKVPDHFTSFEVIKDGKKLTEVRLSIPGKHNILNALAVIAVCDIVKADLSKCVLALSKFTGADRRFQIKYEANSITIIDDYAHHPTEIAATLRGAKQFYPDNRIVAVFQPHQHSRTKALLEDFSKAFEDADKVYIPEIYAVRDTKEDIESVSSKDLVNLINSKEQKAEFFKDFDDCLKRLKETTKSGDVVITIGAGPIYKIGEQLSTFYTQNKH